MIPRSPVLPQKRKRLSFRQKVKMHDEHGSLCIVCRQLISAGERFIDEHVLPLAIGHSSRDLNAKDNRGPAHIHCAKLKTADDRRAIDKSYRIRARDIGIKTRQGPPMPGSRDDTLHRKKKINRKVVDRRTNRPFVYGEPIRPGGGR